MLFRKMKVAIALCLVSFSQTYIIFCCINYVWMDKLIGFQGCIKNYTKLFTILLTISGTILYESNTNVSVLWNVLFTPRMLLDSPTKYLSFITHVSPSEHLWSQQDYTAVHPLLLLPTVTSAALIVIYYNNY